MKKLFSIIFAVTLAANLALSAVAAPSPTGASIIQSITGVDINEKSVNPTYLPLADVSLPDTKKLEVNQDYKIVAAMDVTVPKDTKFPVNLTFKVQGVNEKSTCTVLHFVNGKWEIIPAKSDNGTITATFKSLSPVVILLDSSTVKAIEQVYGYDPSVDFKSPQTGTADMTWIYVVSTLCLVGSAFAFVAGRKKAIAAV